MASTSQPLAAPRTRPGGGLGGDDHGRDRPALGVLVAGIEDAQLVALGLGQHDPRHVLLPDVGGGGACRHEPLDPVGLVLLGAGVEVEVDPVLAHLGVVGQAEHERDPGSLSGGSTTFSSSVVGDRPARGLDQKRAWAATSAVSITTEYMRVGKGVISTSKPPMVGGWLWT